MAFKGAEFIRIGSSTRKAAGPPVAEALAHDRLIKRNQAGGYDITNLGAILFARRLAEFPGLRGRYLPFWAGA